MLHYLTKTVDCMPKHVTEVSHRKIRSVSLKFHMK